MAVSTGGAGIYVLTASGDVLPGRNRVGAIHIHANVAGGSTVLQAGGITIYSQAPTVQRTTALVFASPVDLDNLTLSTGDPDCPVTVMTV